MVLHLMNADTVNLGTDRELDLRIHHALQNALRNERELRIPARPPPSPPLLPTGRVDSFLLDDSDSDSDWDSEPDTSPNSTADTPAAGDRQQDQGHKRGSIWANLNRQYEFEKHVEYISEFNKHSELVRNRPMSWETRHLLELGLHAMTFEGDDGDEFASRELLPLGERRAMRDAKFEKMRTGRVDEFNDVNTNWKYKGLLLDQPVEPLQPEAAWLQEQAARKLEPELFKHERLWAQNEQRVLNKARNFDQRKDSFPQETTGFVRLKPCLVSNSKLDMVAVFALMKRPLPWAAKKVRFDDVHVASKLRWVDVEHVGELEQSEPTVS